MRPKLVKKPSLIYLVLLQVKLQSTTPRKASQNFVIKKELDKAVKCLSY